MTVNIDPRVRLVIYLFTGVGSLVVAYLAVKGMLGDPEVALWAGFTTLVNGLSASNVDLGDKK